MNPKEYYAKEYHVQLKKSPLNYMVYGYIASLKPESVFEFGCNAGRHLKELNKYLGCSVRGLDINEEAIKYAQEKHKINVKLGDESDLPFIPMHDVVLTNSVLCHIEDIEGILYDLKRIGKTVICVESQQTHGQFWYRHEYEGFTKVLEYYAEEVNRKYNMYVWHRGDVG